MGDDREQQRFDNAVAQLRRYGGRPCADVVNIIELLSDLNDNWAHLRSIAIIAGDVHNIQAALTQLYTHYSVLGDPARLGTKKEGG